MARLFFFFSCILFFLILSFSAVPLYYHLLFFKKQVCLFCSNHKIAHPAPTRVALACCRPAYTAEAQHSAISHAQSSEARTCRSGCDSASKRTGLARASISSSICSALCSQIQRRKSTSAGAKKIGDHKKLVMMREGFAPSNRNTTILHSSRSYIFVRRMHAASGFVFLEHGALGICKSSVCTYLTMGLYALHPHCVVVYYLLVSKRSGRKPLAERSALYFTYIHLYLYITRKIMIYREYY